MKASITASGCLQVEPENDLEQYALAHWHRGWEKSPGQQASTLMICRQEVPQVHHYALSLGARVLDCKELLTLNEAMARVLNRDGGTRATSRRTGLDVGYISRLHHEEKENPSDDTLALLGLEKIVMYKLK